MSQLLIQKYLNDLSDLRRVSGSRRESVVREAFKTLLKDWGRSKGLLFIAEYQHTTPMGERRYVDGALVEPPPRIGLRKAPPDSTLPFQGREKIAPSPGHSLPMGERERLRKMRFFTTSMACCTIRRTARNMR